MVSHKIPYPSRMAIIEGFKLLVGSPLTAEDGAAIIPPRGHLRFTEVLA